MFSPFSSIRNDSQCIDIGKILSAGFFDATTWMISTVVAGQTPRKETAEKDCCFFGAA
ncbi:MAG: hypothetical protein Q7U64_13330 [Desulfocapsaceae bacterium]|nr:hypothetical protein [Desulfocapsaceae bacterium]